MKVRKKPVVVDAWPWESWPLDAPWTPSPSDGKRVVHDSLQGHVLANEGDYLIRGVKGEYYPCAPDVFNATYEAVDDE